MTALLTTEDTLILDEMLGHEAGCQVPHTETTCSGPVTHRVITECGRITLACTNSAMRTLRLIEGRNSRCASCKQPAHLDWTVLPA